MISAVLVCLAGLLLIAGGIGWELGWGWAAVALGAGLLAAGLLLDFDKPDRQETP